MRKRRVTRAAQRSLGATPLSADSHGCERQLGEINVMLAEAVKVAEALKGDFAAFEARLRKG